MKISNYMNNANLIVEKNATKAKKEDSQTNEKHTMEQSAQEETIRDCHQL